MTPGRLIVRMNKHYFKSFNRMLKAFISIKNISMIGADGFDNINNGHVTVQH